jgi:hypothetical protein
MLMDWKTILRYGLPCEFIPHNGYKTPWRIRNLLEQNVARMYVMEYDLHTLRTTKPFHPLLDRMEMDLEVHVKRLGEFVLDYLTMIAIGESRHGWDRGVGPGCERCEKQMKASTASTREEAMHNGILNIYKGYEDVLTTLMHVFYEHTWNSRSYGGWKWGNVAYLSYELYKALKKEKGPHILLAIDRIMQVAHNGGSALASKVAWYHMDVGRLYRILWCKRTGHSCCYRTLRAYANQPFSKTLYTHCVHALDEPSNAPAVVLSIEHRNKTRWGNCIECGKILTWGEQVDGHCPTGCPRCGKCTCMRYRFSVDKNTCITCGTKYILIGDSCVCVGCCNRCARSVVEEHRVCHKCWHLNEEGRRTCKKCRRRLPLIAIAEPPLVQPKYKPKRVVKKKVKDDDKQGTSSNVSTVAGATG